MDRTSMVPAIAVVGASALLPGPGGTDGFWRTVVSGADRVTEVPPTHWLVEDHYDPDPTAPDKTYGRRGGFLSPVPFDPLAFGIPPTTLPATDTSQLLTLIVAEQLLAQLAPTGLDAVDRDRVSVILGTSALEMVCTMAARVQGPVWRKAMREAGVPEDQAEAICERITQHYVPWQEATLPGLLSNVVAGRVANRFDLHGSNYTTDAACASSLAALASSINELALGQADLVLTGGVDTLNDPFMYTCFSKTPALSPTGDCRPFSAGGDGMVLGEGVVLFALRRLADAERDGNRVLAVIRGMGTASDGRTGAIYAPQASGQVRALRRAYEAAGYGPETVELVEAHGTATVAGDAAEFAALRQVFRESGRAGTGWCALGSVKSQIGHTKSAAGAAGLLKAVLALHHRVVPPTIKVDRPNPELELADSPFYLNTVTRPWISDGTHPRRAAVSSFGFGGTDFHVTVEEFTPGPNSRASRPLRLRAAPDELVLLSAQTPGELVRAARRLADHPLPLTAVARESQFAFDHTAPARLGVVVTDDQDLATRLRSAADRISADPGTPFHGPGEVHYGVGPATAGPVGFVFSGQGSQYVGMGSGVAMLLPAAQETWDAVAAADRAAGRDPVHQAVFPQPVFDDGDRAVQQARLNRTEWAQPALAAVSLAALELLRAIGVVPQALAGHSFGELTALHAAGCFDGPTLLSLARLRGELMRDHASTPGAMSAVTGTPDEVRALLTAVAEPQLWLANHNAPRQSVVSGGREAVAAFERHAEAAGYTVRRLAAAGAFHTPIIASAAEPLRRALDALTLGAPRIPVYTNVDGGRYPTDSVAIRDILTRQLVEPVRFAEVIEAMYADGVRTFIEIGAGAVLTRLTGDILTERPHLAVSLDRRNGGRVNGALARLAVSGLRLDFAPLWEPYEPDAPQRPVEGKKSMTVELLGTNYGKPYPPVAGGAVLPPPVRTQQKEIVVPPSPVVPSSRPEPDHVGHTEWLGAIRETQRHVAEAHAAYQQAMTESHLAFLRLSEAALTGLPSELSPAQTAPAVLSDHMPPAVETAAPAQPQPRPNPIAAAPQLIDPVPVPPEVVPEPAGGCDVGVLLEVVSDKTGYPVDILDVGMELESDLGIDSIKRVEILSAVRARMPGVVPADATVLSGARTLREIADLLGGVSGVASVAEVVPEPAGGCDVGVLLEVVSDKTGYPVDILDVGMELESDLGIDSIKRVEILSAVRARMPGVVPADATVLSGARTLREIADLLGGSTTSAPATPTPSAVSESTKPAGSAPNRYMLRAVPASPCGFALPGLLDRRVGIIGGPTRIARSLADRLIAHGVRASVVTEVPDGIEGLILLGGLGQRVGAPEEFAAARESFRLARAFAAKRASGPGAFVTVQDTGGDFGRSGSASDRAWAAGFAPLARTAALEWPEVAVKAIDCDTRGRDEDDVALSIARELLTGGSTTDIGLDAHGGRNVMHTEMLPPVQDRPVRIGPDSVLVVSGGGRGITAAALRAAADLHPTRIILLGRTPLRDEPPYTRGVDDAAVRDAIVAHHRTTGQALAPRLLRVETADILAVREIRETINALEASGSLVRYLSVDVTDTEAVRSALAKVRAEWGPVTGLIHGAGTLADKTILDKTDQQFDRVFDTKVTGLRTLLAATEDDPLDLLCVFSSIAACHGNIGQADYAMANEIMAHLAVAEGSRRPDCVVRAIAWGAWDGGMVDAALAEHFVAGGKQLIQMASGAQAFVDEIRVSEPAHVLVAAGRVPAPVAPGGQLAVTARNHPYLADHVIAGRPVVPVALALEWFTAAARSVRPELPVCVTGFEVLSKIGLDDFDGSARILDFTVGIPDPTGAVALTLTGANGRPHYRATVGTAGTGLGVLSEPDDLDPIEHEIYDGWPLFHGPAFQVLTDVVGVAREGALATLGGLSGRGWPGEDWHIDPAAVDGALQLAALWAEVTVGGAVLPMGVAEFRVFAPGPLDGRATAVLRSVDVDQDGAVCDIQVRSENGQPLFELGGVRLIVRPDNRPDAA